MFNFGKKTRETVGLDIGNHSIKVASIVKEAGRKILSSYYIKKLPVNGINFENLRELISETFKEAGLKPEAVNMSVSGVNIIVRFITLPKMTKEQMEEAMAIEAERYIPFKVDEVIMDSVILDDCHDGQMNVLLVAAKTDFIEKRLETMEKLGIKTNLIDVSAFSVFNAGLAAGAFSEGKGTVFIDLGYSETDVLISTGRIPRFMRLIQIGGRDMAESLGGEMGVIKEGAAEENLPAGGEGGMPQAALDVLDELIKEVKLSIGYFENKHNDSIAEIYCSGGMVYQKGLVEYLGSKLGVAVKVWDPMTGIEIAEGIRREEINPVVSCLAGSIGLALRE